MAHESHAVKQPLVVLMVDGVGVSVARDVWPHAEIRALVSTFPTTSATAWLTALTGAAVGRHLVPGMAFRIDNRDVMAIGPAPHNLVGDAAAGSSVFSRLVSDGVPVTILPGMIARYPGPWANALWGKAKVVCGEPYLLTPDDPRTAIGKATEAVDRFLVESAGVVVVYLDVDAAVHHEGYSARVRQALREVEQVALRWRAAGVAVIALSDHGAVPVEPDDQIRRRLDRLVQSGQCSSVVGGAGRVRWFYLGDPQCSEAQAVVLADSVRATLGDVAWVATRAQAITAGLFPAQDELLHRIGDVIAVALDPRFPVPDDNARYEHGATSAAESLVPFAVW